MTMKDQFILALIMQTTFGAQLLSKLWLYIYIMDLAEREREEVKKNGKEWGGKLRLFK